MLPSVRKHSLLAENVAKHTRSLVTSASGPFFVRGEVPSVVQRCSLSLCTVRCCQCGVRVSRLRWSCWLPYPWWFEAGYVITTLEVVSVLFEAASGHFCLFVPLPTLRAGRLWRSEATLNWRVFYLMQRAENLYLFVIFISLDKNCNGSAKDNNEDQNMTLVDENMGCGCRPVMSHAAECIFFR